MLLLVSTTVEFLSGLFSWSNADEGTPADGQGLMIDARLPELWFEDIPHCTLRCLYGPALACGCAYSDFDCICRAFSEIAGNAEIKNCITACPHNEDGRWGPDRILDFCQLVTGDDIQLPNYMNQYAGVHRRQAIPVTESQKGGTYYPSFPFISTISTISTSAQPLAAATGSVITSATSFITTLEPTTTISTGVVITSATTTSSSSASSSAPPPTGGLSTGAKTGIGVAVPLVVISILLGIFWFRRKQARDKKVHQGTGSDDIPDMSKQFWPKNLSSTASRPLPAEADSNPIHEPDSNAIHEFDGNPVSSSRHLRSSDTPSPIVYELNAQPSVRAPPPAVLASNKWGESIHDAAFTEDLSTNETLSKASLSSPVFVNDPKPATSREVDAAMQGKTTSAPAHLHHQSSDNNQEQTQLSPAKPEKNIDMDLLDLEAEIVRVREQRERLQHLQMLEDREEQLRKEIQARKSGLSKSG